MPAHLAQLCADETPRVASRTAIEDVARMTHRRSALTLGLVALFALVFGFGSPARADELADAKAFIGKQVELIKKADVDGLKAGFTKRLQDKITKANVEKAQKQLDKMTLDELVASAAPAGKDSIKIKMKNGRTLTTLVKVDGKWLADTVWFK
jgi:hypothetical protein